MAVTETVEIPTPEVGQEAEIPTDTPPASSTAENAGAIPGRTINAVGSNLRQGPDLDQAVVVVLPADTRILALARTADGNWVRVLAPTLVQRGWLRIDQVELEGDVMTLPEAPSGE
ncbi:MAG: SH3 domain-containing protein [Caldilineae bacterium]|nr:MAG: SH3 domain-containing protein [Caldilineae bacterium]